MKIKESKYFELHELLPPEIFAHLVENNILWKGWMMFPYTTIETIDTIRQEFGTTFINTYGLSDSIQARYGRRVDSGLRIRDLASKPTYFSAHHNGLGTDSICANVSATEQRKFILANPNKFPHIMRLECTIKGEEIGWLHQDSISVHGRIVELHL